MDSASGDPSPASDRRAANLFVSPPEFVYPLRIVIARLAAPRRPADRAGNIYRRRRLPVFFGAGDCAPLEDRFPPDKQVLPPSVSLVGY